MDYDEALSRTLNVLRDIAQDYRPAVLANAFGPESMVMTQLNGIVEAVLPAVHAATSAATGWTGPSGGSGRGASPRPRGAGPWVSPVPPRAPAGRDARISMLGVRPRPRARSQIEQDTQDEFGKDASPIDEVMQLEDDGSGITVLTADPGRSILCGGALSATACVLGETDAPSSLLSKMSSTTALMGRWEDAWGDRTVEWSFTAGVLAAFEAYFATA